MDNSTSAIWIQVGNQGRKSITIGGMYREQHLLGFPTPNPTAAPNLQLARWNKMLAGWKAAVTGDKNCVIIGDLNLDHARWNNPSPGNQRMVERTKLVVETMGFSQLIKTITRSWPGQEDSIVDHLWSNIPEE